ncbi:AI-2E family transporter [Ancylomarina euxinus]|uniref:AI-2E family transporter n=1 Tax=Ancylomarina euxinus TaxID=2283627 RepID=A0A425Y325_9BACT|nr:AI-2E family transporter [Ancylomarina euxinus]MCZ4693196.1 AI-2E family transporter [Ancylomarina euxinus]MUP15333.1 AI-2E family transporter [Ancylomarina euxinus]RRG22540.1 AI-2E family transporter [Ancylomarina euxinus]
MNGKGKYLIAAVGLLFLGLIFWYFSAILAYIGIAVVLSFIGRPVVDFLNKATIKKHPIPTSVSAGLTLALLWLVMVVFFRTFIPMIVEEAKQLSNIDVQSAVRSLDEPIRNIEAFISKYSTEGGDFKIQAVITENLSSVLKFSDISSIFGSLAGTVGGLFIALFSISFITFFFLKDSSLFVDSLVLFVPEKNEEGVRHVLDSIKNLLMRYFVGLFFEVILVGTMVTIGLSIVGMGFSHAVVIGLFAGLINVIPYIGPIIGTMFGLIIGIATNLDVDFYTQVVPLLGYTALVFFIVQLIDNILFQPLIYSNSVNAHPLEIFLVILFAGSMSGILGMMLAIPAYTIFRVIAKEFFNKYRFVRKLTEKIK